MVFAGARPSEASIRDPHSAQLVAAPHAVANALTRRAGVDAHIRTLLFVAPASAVDLSAPPSASIDLVASAPPALISSSVPARSARGPPRS